MDIGLEIIKPKLSQQEILLQKLRKKILPVFTDTRRYSKPRNTRINIDSLRRNKTERVDSE